MNSDVSKLFSLNKKFIHHKLIFHRSWYIYCCLEVLKLGTFWLARFCHLVYFQMRISKCILVKYKKFDKFLRSFYFLVFLYSSIVHWWNNAQIIQILHTVEIQLWLYYCLFVNLFSLFLHDQNDYIDSNVQNFLCTMIK